MLRCPQCALQFGASELSDISGFVELPDGKVVSGTERLPKIPAATIVQIVHGAVYRQHAHFVQVRKALGVGGSLCQGPWQQSDLLFVPRPAWRARLVDCPEVELMRAKDGLTAQEAATNLAGSRRLKSWLGLLFCLGGLSGCLRQGHAGRAWGSEKLWASGWCL